ncbi:putative pollen-specific protein SF3-like [Capsicum annuum]|nr:putative pollen-specific protein SF3-like [Capsicum annuum]
MCGKMSLHLRASIQILLAISLFLNHYEVEGEQRLSKAEDLELEKQLKLLNKPSIQTIKYINNGDWWLYIGEDYKAVGYWPQKIFTTLKSYATSAEFEGFVYSPPGIPEPSMGSGHFPVGDKEEDAYCKKSIYFTDDNNQAKSLDDILVKLYEKSPNLYRVTDYPDAYYNKSGNGVLYGGPVLNYAEIEARHSLSEAEDLELERQLKLLNKPAIKTIKMKPTLHTLQGDDTSSNVNRPFNIELEGRGCPTRTVPIRRITKDDLIRQIHLSQVGDANDSPDDDDIKFSLSYGTRNEITQGGLEFATVQIPDNPTNKLAGAGAILSLHNPQIYEHQFTGGFIKVQNGIDNIQVGWITGKSACFNTRCPGFVHVNSAIPLDGELLSSTYGGPIYDIPMYIARDASNGNWWFRIGSNYTGVGFWPAKIFTKLNGFATSAEYGGVAHSNRGDPDIPSMGGGYLPAGNLTKDGYCRKSIFINDKNQMKSLIDIPVKLYASNPHWYRVADSPDSKDIFGRIGIFTPFLKKFDEGRIKAQTRINTIQKLLQHLRATLQILVAISLLSSYAKIEARQSLSEVEDLELERQLKLINKPAIKTIKMKPTLPNLLVDDTSSNIHRPYNIELEGGGCPTGTVPIRRITKDDLIQQGFLSQIRGALPDGDFATVQVPDNQTNKIAGAGAILSLHNPQNISGYQFSGVLIKLQNVIDSVQAGWMAGKLACFNTRCPGFIQINTAVSLDAQLGFSTYGGPIYEETMHIARDLSNGNWRFLIQSRKLAVGFWPAKIFTKLNGFATSAEFGGFAHSPRGVPEPPMGSSHFPVGNLKQDAYCRNSTYLNDNNQTKSVHDFKLKLHADSPTLYRSYDNTEPKFDALLTYGGPAKRSLSEVEDLELERQLNLLNKPAIKTIKMKPTLPNLQGDDTPSNINRPFNIELEGGGCPTGTDIKFSISYGTKSTVYQGGLQFATVQIPDNPVNKLAGAGAILSLHNPQISGGFIKVQNGIDNIQVRWITGKSACFNTRCPGFVHVNSAIPLDGELLSSTYGGPIYDIPMYIARDKSNGNWWFRIGSNYTAIGFWPATIFTKLNGFATSVEYGGVAHYARGDPDAPSMGGGYFPVGDLKKDGYCRNSIYINDKNQMKSLDDIPVKLYNSPWYRVTDYPKYGAGYGNIVLYGGPLHGNIVDSQ